MGFVVRVINLDRSPDRLASFKAHNPGLPIERMAAVDGRRIDREACIRADLITRENKYSPVAIGIAASHVSLWQACAAGSEPFHIAEDDAIFHPDFVDYAANNLGGLPDWDAVYWGFNFDWPMEIELAPSIGPTVMFFNQAALIGRLDTYRPSRFRPVLARLRSCAGIAAYSISLTGARRYLERCLPIGDSDPPDVTKRKLTWSNFGLDAEMSRHHPALATYVCLPPLAVTPNDYSRSTNR